MNTRFASVCSLLFALTALTSCKDGCGKSQQAAENSATTTVSAPMAMDFVPTSNDKFRVVVGRPTGDADLEPQIALTFSRAVVTLESLDDEAKLAPPATISPPIEGKWRWLGSSSVEFVPTAKLPLATEFTVSMKAGYRAWDGATLEADHSFSFRTPRPRVWSVSPESGYSWLKTDQVFTVTTNQPFKNLADKAFLMVGGKRVALTVASNKPYAREEYDYPPEYGFDQTATVYELKPASPLPLDQDVLFQIDTDVQASVGSLGLAEPFKANMRTYGPLKFRTVRACVGSEECPYGPLVLVTTNPLKLETLKTALKVTPSATIDWERASSHESVGNKESLTVLSGRFLPGQRYDVTLAAGVEDSFGQKMGEEKGNTTLSHLRPMFEAGPRLALLEDSGDGALPIESVNLKTLEAKLYKLTPETLAPLLFDFRKTTRPGPPQALSMNLAGTKNRQRTQPFDVKNPLQGGRLFLVDFTAPELKDKYQRNRTVIGQITDLAVHTKIGATSGVVWVTRLSNGQAVADADVTAYDETGKSRFTGKTNAEGLLVLPALSQLAAGGTDDAWRSPRVLVAARLGDDLGVTLSDADTRFVPYRISSRGTFQPYSPESLGNVFAERGIYRPGETVFVKAVMRSLRLGQIERPAEGTEVTIEAQDDNGTVLARAKAKASKHGTVDTSLPIKKEAALGYYGLYARWNHKGKEQSLQSYFRVEEYRAPTFTVDVFADKELLSGAELGAKVNGRYLFGGAMSQAAVQWTVDRTNVTFTPEKNEGFNFGEYVDPYEENSTSYEATNVVGRGNTTLDGKGLLDIAAGKAETPGDRPHRYTVEAEVTDVNRQRVANRTSILVHPSKIYIGQRIAGDGFAAVGKPINLELVAAAHDGARVANVAIDNELFRREWKNIRKKGYGGEWHMVSEPSEESVGKCEAKSASDATTCTFKADKPGSYVVVSKAKDGDGRSTSSRYSFYVVGEGWFSWGRDDTDKLSLVPDRERYKPGDTAKILVKSPYPEAEALVTTEREGVMDTRRLKIASAAATIDVPITEAAIPNFYVSVMLVRGRVASDKGVETGEDPGRPAMRIGYAELKVEKASKRLAVAVTPDAKEKHPRDTVQVRIDVKNHLGQPANGEVTLWAVDEAVLRLTGYTAPDLLESMYPRRSLHVALAEPLVNLILRRLYQEKGQTPGGGGGGSEGSNVRNQFKTTAHFVGSLQTKDGVAETSFKLPDNLTTFRLMAVVVGEDERYGSGDSSVSVSKPLLAMPALPRLIRVGDKVEAGVVVHRHGATIEQATVSVEAEGATVEGDTKRVITFTNDKPVEVRFALSAKPVSPAQPGEAKLRFSVTAAGLEDRVEQVLPIRWSTPLETVAIHGDTEGEAKEGFTPPSDILPDVGGLEVAMSSTALSGYQASMGQLLEYPYGCLEQLSSRLVPLVALKQLSKRFGSGDNKNAFSELALSWLGKTVFGPSSVDEVVSTTIHKIEGKQNGDGGYSYWDRNGCSAVEASSLAYIALTQAQRAGFAVSKDRLDVATRFLENVAAGQRSGCDIMPPSAEVQVAALYALARAGSPRSHLEPDLFALRDKLSLEGKAMLADAMAVSGARKAQAKQVLEEISSQVKETPSSVHLEQASYGDFGSHARATAIYLQALLDGSPSHPYITKAVRYLGEVRTNGRYRTTQEAAFVLTAINDLVNAREKDTANFTASVALAGKSLASHAFTGRSLDVWRESIASSAYASLAGPLPFVFKKEGEGRLYYSANLRYALKTPRTKAVDQGIAMQRWLEPYGDDGKPMGGQALQFKAGALVRLNIRVASRQARKYVAIDVPIPAGFEIVDNSLASNARVPALNEEGELSAPSYDDFFYSPFNHSEKRDDRVVIFSDDLQPGVYTQRVALRATTPGRFTWPEAHAEEMYHPEVFGSAPSDTVTIVVASEVAAK